MSSLYNMDPFDKIETVSTKRQKRPPLLRLLEVTTFSVNNLIVESLSSYFNSHTNWEYKVVGGKNDPMTYRYEK